MSVESQYFLDSAASVVELECIEISHLSFSKVYYIVRNAISGVTVTHEDASSHVYEYYPLKITRTGAADDLDQVMEIQLGDLGQLIPTELDRVRAAGTKETKPSLKFRTYRSDDLTTPLTGPYLFEMKDLSSKKEGVTFQATAPKLNQSSTGERYTMVRFPMLKGFI